MPTNLAGDIFKEITHRAYDLAVVFGHFGFNQLALSWGEFKGRYPNRSNVGNPFTRFKCHPVLIGGDQWIWFIPEEHNHGLSDQRLIEVLMEVVIWCKANRIRSVITNGIADVDRTGVTAQNRMSDDRRASLLREFLEKHETDDLQFTLINLSDIFLR